MCVEVGVNRIHFLFLIGIHLAFFTSRLLRFFYFSIWIGFFCGFFAYILASFNFRLVLSHPKDRVKNITLFFFFGCLIYWCPSLAFQYTAKTSYHKFVPITLPIFNQRMSYSMCIYSLVPPSHPVWVLIMSPDNVSWCGS